MLPAGGAYNPPDCSKAEVMSELANQQQLPASCQVTYTIDCIAWKA